MDLKDTVRNFEYKNPRLQRIIRSLTEVAEPIALRQDTADVEQLKPVERLQSIEKVWLATREKLGKPKTAIDAGSGFGYGTIFLDTVGIRAVGVERVEHKVKQGIALFGKVGVPISRAASVDFSNTPAMLSTDLTSLPDGTPKADLVTMFYLSGEMAMNANVMGKCRELLNEGGTLVMSTEAPLEVVKEVVAQNPIPGVSVELIEVEDNFERTAILVRFQ